MAQARVGPLGHCSWHMANGKRQTSQYRYQLLSSSAATFGQVQHSPRPPRSSSSVMKATYAVPALALLIYRAHSRQSLTTGGLFAATLTGIAHAYHPWNLPFVLLCVFFLAGTRVTHIKEDVKARLTVASKGSSGGGAPRTHVQVFANSLVASILSVIHGYQLRQRAASFLLQTDTTSPALPSLCYSWAGDLLVVGIIANYAAVAADTFSSELGILAKGSPRLLTSLSLRKVPPGTNGAVTLTGLGAGFLGSMIIVTTSMLFTPFCNAQTAGYPGGGHPWTQGQQRIFMMALTVWGFLGSVLDSFLGGLLQRTVKDARSGKIVEGEGGERVLVSAAAAHSPTDAVGTAGNTSGSDAGRKYDAANKQRRSSFGNEKPTRVVESGWDILDNNDVNFLMAFTMSIGAMAGAAWYWGIPLSDVLAGATA
ncbi:integral membrane protein DUF92-domain-containing protein [Coniella lustricola]|uniref:Integral membrane protein DUF92-domain-containing protein n=1 Tax=Coniella lustricola TaxID=2025994 RepID=A0A2T3ACQ4_9PEZI|nr:integral membrane protein DUF92-domain-containing protein [Coniella lustricola]